MSRVDIMSRGFTLIELMVTLTVAAILLAIAAPALGQFVAGSQLRSASSDLLFSLSLARSEAVRRNTAVVLEPLSGTDWRNGWTVKVGTTVLNQHGPLPDSISAVTGNAITFRGDGRTATAGFSDAVFVFGIARYPTVPRRCVYVRAGGSPLIKTDKDMSGSCDND